MCWISSGIGLREKDKVTKALGIYSSKRLYQDWTVAKPIVNERKAAKWDAFVAAMQAFYKPTENLKLRNFHFRKFA